MFDIVHNGSTDLPAGVIEITAPVVLHSGESLHGAGSGATTLVPGRGYEGPLVELDGSNITVDGLTLQGSSAAGLEQIGAGTFITIHDVVSFHNLIGFELQGTAFGVLDNDRAEGNTLDGFQIVSDATSVALQWNLTNTLAIFNGGYGYHVVAAVAGYGTSGQWVSISTFANAGGGLLFEATVPNASLNDIRINGINASTDGGHELVLNTGGGEHNQVIGGLIEGAGQGWTGVDMLTPPSHGGGGVLMLGDNLEVVLSGLSIRGCSDNGIAAIGTLGHLSIFASMVSENSLGGYHRTGGIDIESVGTVATIYGVQSWGWNQAFGLYTVDPTTTFVAGSYV